MSEPGPDNLVPMLLRRIDARVDALAADMIEVKERLGLTEASAASISRRLDRVSGDVERLQRRPDLSDAPAP